MMLDIPLESHPVSSSFLSLFSYSPAPCTCLPGKKEKKHLIVKGSSNDDERGGT